MLKHLTPANIDERVIAKELVKGFKGKVYGDKGYISKELKEELENVDFIARQRKNIKKDILSEYDEHFLKKRSLIETVNDFLKNVCQVDHSRHRSIPNFFVNAIAAITAYSFIKQKPSIKLNDLKFQPIVLFK